MDLGLGGRTALVTGANWGIGAAIARELAGEGVRVAVHYLGAPRADPPGGRLLHEVRGAEAAARIVAEIRAGGGVAAAVEADLALPDAAQELCDAAEAMLGPLTILVNNAAHCEAPDHTLAFSAGLFDRTFAVNARAPVLLARQLASRINRRGERWGRIVGISTDAAQQFPTQVAYGASKAAHEAFTRSLATELGPLGITVNVVAPGPVQTGWMDRETVARVLPHIPVGRVGTPEDIAGAVAYLCSERACWITGQVLRVCGGHVM